MTPERFGPYVIQRKLGSGGMGDVFAAEHEQTREPAAIKVLSAQLARQSGFRGRFEVEIETLRRLDHESIVRIFGFGEQDGTLYYAMELVDGHSLESLIHAQQKLPWRQVLAIANQLCRALRHAHDRGIIHRDIKPANIMMLSDGRVKLADFGIAQLYGVSGLTLDGGIVGTANYLSPEQADGSKATARSDLYSLGATLYALLTGRPPFVGRTLPEVLKLQRTATPLPPSHFTPDIPRELDAVILGLLAKQPQDRIGSLTTLARALQAVEDGVALHGAGNPASTAAASSASSDTTQAGALNQTVASPAAADETPVRAQANATQVHDPQATVASIIPASVDIPVEDDAESTTEPANVFITAQEAAQLDYERQQEKTAPSPREIPLGTILLSLLLIAVCVIIFFVVRPPSADKLYSHIVAASQSGDAQQLLNAAGDIDEFRQLYPTDPRLPELAPIEQQISQIRTNRLLPIAQRHFNTGQNVLPLAQLRDQAMLLAVSQPQQALEQLQAILTLAGDPSKLPEEDRAIVAQITQQIDQLKQQATQSTTGHLLLIRQRLNQARAMMAEDPAQARSLAQAIVLLYADKPWAQDMVEQAKQLADEGKASH